MINGEGTITLSWRLGVLVAILSTLIGGAFWAGNFTSRIDNMSKSLTNLSTYSTNMGIKVDLLRELDAADNVGDKAVERRLERTEKVLVRIEMLLRTRNRQGISPYE